MLGDSRGAHRRPWPRWLAAVTRRLRRGSRDGAVARRMDGSIGRRHSHSPQTRCSRGTQLAESINDVDLQARCCLHLAYVVSHRGEFQRAMDLTDRSDSLYDRAGSTVGSGRQLALRRPRSDLSGGQQRSTAAATQVERWLRSSTTPGCTFAAMRCLANSLASIIASTTPVAHLGRAAETSRRLGFLQTEAYQTLQSRASAMPGR